MAALAVHGCPGEGRGHRVDHRIGHHQGQVRLRRESPGVAGDSAGGSAGRSSSCRPRWGSSANTSTSSAGQPAERLRTDSSSRASPEAGNDPGESNQRANRQAARGRSAVAASPEARSALPPAPTRPRDPSQPLALSRRNGHPTGSQPTPSQPGVDAQQAGGQPRRTHRSEESDIPTRTITTAYSTVRTLTKAANTA